MKNVPAGMLAVVLLSLPCQARAGKVDSVRKAVKDACNKDVPVEILVSSVVRAYECELDQEVTIAGCKIKCLKAASGNVVGK